MMHLELYMKLLGSIVDKCFLVSIYHIHIWLYPLNICRPTLHLIVNS